MASFIELQQDSLEFRSNASISAHPGRKKESVWTQKACHIIYCAWPGREVKEASDPPSFSTRFLIHQENEKHATTANTNSRKSKLNENI